MRIVGGKRPESLWLYAMAGALMVGGPVWRELYMAHYPARPEAFVLPLAAAAIGAIVAAGSWLAGGLLGTATFGGLLFVFADLQLDLERWTYTAAVLGGCVALALVLFYHRAAISTLALGAFYLASLVRPAIAPPPTTLDTSGAARSTNPLLVHIILDGQWGVGGLRAAGDSVTAPFLTDFYLKRGFELHESAYSRYAATMESIPAALSLGQTLVGPVQRLTPYVYRVSRNPYFERLHELQYDIRVYETTFLDFCNSPDVAVASCEVQSGNSIRNIGFYEGSWMARGMTAARFFLNTRSHVYDRLNPERTDWRGSVAGGGLATLQRLTEAIAARPTEGTAYFVHVLLTHHPVEVDADCRVLNDPPGHIRYGIFEHPGDSLWREALRFYGDQIRCAHRALARVIDAIDSTVGRDHSIVIVHGDHGARMHPRAPLRDALDAYTADELNANFATLLAIRRPNVRAALHAEAVPIQDAIWELARSDFAGPLPKTWQNDLRQMPDSTNAHGLTRPLAAGDMLWARRPE
jgi:hypothetical protein